MSVESVTGSVEKEEDDMWIKAQNGQIAAGREVYAVPADRSGA